MEYKCIHTIQSFAYLRTLTFALVKHAVAINKQVPTVSGRHSTYVVPIFQFLD